MGGFSPNADNPDVLFGMARVSEADSGSGVLLPPSCKICASGGVLSSLWFFFLLAPPVGRTFVPVVSGCSFSVGAIVSTRCKEKEVVVRSSFWSLCIHPPLPLPSWSVVKDMVMAILFSLLPSVSTATEDPWTMIDVITIKQTIGQIVASNW